MKRVWKEDCMLINLTMYTLSLFTASNYNNRTRKFDNKNFPFLEISR